MLHSSFDILYKTGITLQSTAVSVTFPPEGSVCVCVVKVAVELVLGVVIMSGTWSGGSHCHEVGD